MHMQLIRTFIIKNRNSIFSRIINLYELKNMAVGDDSAINIKFNAHPTEKRERERNKFNNNFRYEKANIQHECVGREKKDIIEMSAYDSIDVLAHCVKRMKN